MELSVREAATLLGRSPRTVRAQLARGELPGVRTLLRLACDVHLISPAGLRFASGRLREIGRMVGGWRKRVESSPFTTMENPSLAM